MASRAISPLNIALMVFLILVWGSSFVVVKWVLQDNITPIAIATFRFIVAGALFVGALALIKFRKPQYKLLVKWKDAPLLPSFEFSRGYFLFYSAVLRYSVGWCLGSCDFSLPSFSNSDKFLLSSNIQGKANTKKCFRCRRGCSWNLRCRGRRNPEPAKQPNELRHRKPNSAHNPRHVGDLYPCRKKSNGKIRSLSSCSLCQYFRRNLLDSFLDS